MQKIKSYWPLALVLVLAAIPRLYNLTHGLGVHPDERHMIMVAENLNLHNLNPKSFAYGSFPYYLLWITSQALGVFWPALTSYDGLFFAGRLISVFFALAGIAVTFFLSASIFHNRAAAYLAAVLLAFNVFHLQLSRFYTVDVIMTTLTISALWAMLALARRGTLATYLMSGFLLGLALATKITALFLLCPLGVAVLVDLIQRKRWLDITFPFFIMAAVLVAAMTFAAVEPYAILDFATFIKHNREQTGMVQGLWRPPYTIQYEHTAPYFYHLKQMLLYTMGWPVALAVFIGMADALVRVYRRFSVHEIIALAYLVPPFLLISQFQVKFPRYMLPFYPVLMCFAAYTLASCGQRWLSAVPADPRGGTAQPQPAAPAAPAGWLTAGLLKFPAFLGRYRKALIGLAVVVTAGFSVAALARVLFYQPPPGIFTGCQGRARGCYDHMMDVAVSRGGTIYAVDMYNSRVQRYDSLGNFVSTWGKQGSGPGEFHEPRGIAVDEDGHVYVMDTWNSRVQKFTADGNFILDYKAEAPLHGAKGVAAAAGKVYVADSGNGRVVVFDTDGEQRAVIGSKGKGPGQLWEPSAVSVGADGAVYVLDSGNNRIQRFSPGGPESVVGTIPDWTGDSLKEGFMENLPDGSVCLADPVFGRVLCFEANGELKVIATGQPGACGLAVMGNKLLVGLRGEGRVAVSESAAGS